MYRLGEIQKLIIVRHSAPGAYLADEKGGGEVLLPGAQVPKGSAEGDEISVFIYKDSQGRPVATVREPLITLGRVKRLTVTSVSDIGAFLDMGLERDLFLPFKEQTYHVKAGDEVLCAMYLDKSSRLCATMKLYKYLEPAPAGRLRTGGMYEAAVYELRPERGAFVAVEDEYPGLIPPQELVRPVRAGERLTVRVSRIRPDGRLDLSLREKAYRSIEGDVKRLLAYRDAHGGDFPFDDRSSPESIREAFGMSKAQFKRAYGHLLHPGTPK